MSLNDCVGFYGSGSSLDDTTNRMSVFWIRNGFSWFGYFPDVRFVTDFKHKALHAGFKSYTGSAS
jgi:hypothetical protein